MASSSSSSPSPSPARVSFRVIFVLLILLAGFYVGRPLYWKLSATIHEIRENKQTVKEGISQFVLEAQKSVGWYHDESDPGFDDVQSLQTDSSSNGFQTKAVIIDQMMMEEDPQDKNTLQ